jgi:hypothetical protein
LFSSHTRWLWLGHKTSIAQATTGIIWNDHGIQWSNIVFSIRESSCQPFLQSLVVSAHRYLWLHEAVYITASLSNIYKGEINFHMQNTVPSTQLSAHTVNR